MLKIYLLLLTAGACNQTNEEAATHLHSLGYKDVACSREGYGETFCMADGQRYHCAMTDYSGCRDHNAIACEKLYTERPAP